MLVKWDPKTMGAMSLNIIKESDDPTLNFCEVLGIKRPYWGDLPDLNIF